MTRLLWLVILFGTMCSAFAATVGDQVELRAMHRGGVPFHSTPGGRQTVQRVPNGTVATGMDIAREGRRPQIRVSNQRTGWIAARDVGRTITSPPPPETSAERLAWPVEAAFREAVQLWADEQFEALWERGLRASRYRVSREVFIRGMRHRVVKPTCCWDQVHTVRVHPQATDEALVEAQIGVDVKTLGTTVRRSMILYLRQEEGVWRVTLEDFLTKPEDAQSGLRAPW